MSHHPEVPGFTESQTECDEVRANVMAEKDGHDLVAEPSNVSWHTVGTAFYASWFVPPPEDIESLAAIFSIYRYDIAGDPVHFRNAE